MVSSQSKSHSVFGFPRQQINWTKFLQLHLFLNYTHSSVQAPFLLYISSSWPVHWCISATCGLKMIWVWIMILESEFIMEDMMSSPLLLVIIAFSSVSNYEYFGFSFRRTRSKNYCFVFCFCIWTCISLQFCYDNSIIDPWNTVVID